MAATFKQYLTYQHNVQKYFLDHRDKYSGIIIPLSIATAFPSGTYGFIRALCERDTTKQYAIDPRNALFQKQWNRKNVRNPHRKMADVLGEPFYTVGLEKPVTAASFAEDSVVEAIVQKCLDFQRHFRLRSEDERKLEKYKNLLGLSSLSRLREPQFLIPPYFQFEQLDDPWYSVSKRCVLASPSRSHDIPIRPVLHFACWSGIPDWSNCYRWMWESKIKSFWFYPNNFKEHSADIKQLKIYRLAIESAISNELEPYILFGGYFGILMSYFGLAGFGNGIGYGEWRDSGYHKGGNATTRVYILKLHRFLDAPAAQALIDIDPDYFGNDTDILADCVASERSVEKLRLDECLDHFMECRKIEMDFVATKPLEEAMYELAETIKRLASKPQEREKYGISLENWLAAISPKD